MGVMFWKRKTVEIPEPADLLAVSGPVKDFCVSLFESIKPSMNWEWDTRFSTHLAQISGSSSEAAQSDLGTLFKHCWDAKSINSAPPTVARVAKGMGGLRARQSLYSLDIEGVVIYCAWWPWSVGQTVSVRIGCNADCLSSVDAKTLLQDFQAWFS